MQRILYIGGNLANTEELRAISNNLEIRVCANGLEAMRSINANFVPDCIISELYLPGVNALEIYKLLKSQVIGEGIPFFVIADESDRKLKEQAMQIGIDDFFDGKFSPENLLLRADFLIQLKNLKKGQETAKPALREYKLPWEKRLFDIVVSLTALLLLSPLLILVAIAIRLESKGKVWYASKRVGTGYKIFDFYKFRSMYTGADKDLSKLKHLNQYQSSSEEVTKEEMAEECSRCAALPEGTYCSPVLFKEGQKICEYWYQELKRRKSGATFIKIKNDPRVTKVGRFIRNTSIDELPQLINVLKGDMSIVGNRPLPLYEAEQLTSDDWSARFLGPAGITGLWQVEKRGKKGVMSDEERKALDNQYAETYSFWGDIKLILRTIPALFQKENV
ncbi:MAG TPA: sugar transferase [Bacteroidales bacterium]|nr:sugar transferase [Bacteroidales bacterium]